MGAGFSIAINAVDNGTKVLERINKSLTGMQAPAKNFNTQLSKFGNLSGLTKVGNGFGRIVHESANAGRSLIKVVEPLSVITGAASIGGMALLINKWAEFNTRVDFTAQRLGILPSQLGQLRGSATLAGVSADATEAGFANLGDTLYNVANGQAPEAAYIMTRLGIALTDVRGKARKAQDVLPQLADAVAHIRNPLAQARLATILFGSSANEMLPLLRLGSKGMEELRRQAERYGGVTDAGAAAAVRFSQAQGGITQATTGLVDAIATQLAPVVTPLMLQFAEWIAKGKKSQFVMHDLGEDIKGVATWLKGFDLTSAENEVRDFGAQVKAVYDDLSGWKNTIASIINGAQLPGTTANAPPGVIGGDVGAQGDVRDGHPTALGRFLYDHFDRLRQPDNWLHGGYGADTPNQARPSSAQQTALAGQAVAILMSMGRTRAQAIGLTANLQRESGFNPGAIGDSGLAFGIGQWHPDRQQAFEDWAGHSIRKSTFEEQVRFANWELTNGSRKAAGQLLAQINNPNLAAQILSSQDFAPSDKFGEMRIRGQMADALFNVAPNAPTLTQPAPGAAGATGSVAITLKHDMPNATVTARATGNVQAPRIVTSMPDAGAYTGGMN